MSEFSKRKTKSSNSQSHNNHKTDKPRELSQIEFDNLLHSATEINDYDKKNIYKTLHTVVKATPNIWEQVFHYVALLPQKTYKWIYLLLFKTIYFFGQLTSWFMVTILDDSEFIKVNNIQGLWNELHHLPIDVIKFLVNNTIYKNYDIDRYINDYIHFIFLIRNEEKSERDRIKEDTKKIMGKIEYIKAYNLDKLWNLFKNIHYVSELKTSNVEILNYYKTLKKNDSKFTDLYDLIIKNKHKTIKDDIRSLINNHKKNSKTK